MIALCIAILDFIQTRIPLACFGVRSERVRGFLESPWKKSQPPQESVSWFHASSLGELEMLRPLIDDFLNRGERVGVSVFSDSGLSGLIEISERCVYAGLSPREREWDSLFSHFKIQRLILAKYDFWPGLIHSATRRRCPILVINASNRFSFSLIRVLMGLKGSDGFILFGPSVLPETGDKTSEIRSGVDPRWERVSRRVFDHALSVEKAGKMQKYQRLIEQLPRPIGVLGSAWGEDLEVVLPAFRDFRGSLLIVPHSLQASHLIEIQNRIRSENNHRLVLVPEMGILVELYGYADFAFVGGGFGRGVHSTLEPSVWGIPVACGPRGVQRFPETHELRARGVLRVCTDSKDVCEWIGNIKSKKSGAPGWLVQKRSDYRALLEECLRIR